MSARPAFPDPSTRLSPPLRRRVERCHPGFFSRPVPPAAFCLWSHVGLARNLAGRPFPDSLPAAERPAAVRRLADALSGVWGPLHVFDPADPAAGPVRRWLRADRPLGPMPSPDVRHAIPRRARRTVPGVPSRSAAFLDRDALRLAFDAPGERLEALWKKASETDDALSAVLDFAFSPEFGYLLSSPSLSGNGLSLRCILHLPATALLGLDDPLSAVLREAGCALVPWLPVAPDPDRAPGALYECARVGAPLLPEPLLAAQLSAVVHHLCDREAETLVRLRAHAPAMLLDRARRAPAALSSACRIRAAEALDYLSDLRLAALLGLPGIDDPRRFLDAALAVLSPGAAPGDDALPDDLRRPAALAPFLPAVAPAGSGPSIHPTTPTLP